MIETREIQITKLGRQGDGIAESDKGDIYIPLTLPGETVKADIEDDRGELLSIITPSEDRVKPICKHYQSCGGCGLQHLSQKAYIEWKQNVVIQAFSKAGLDINPEPVKSVPLKSRRRATMDIRRTKKTIQLGFHGRRSNDIVDLEECHIINETIHSQLPNLKNLLRPLLSRKGTSRLHMTSTLNGLDLSIDNVNKELSAELREELGQSARKFGIVRLTVDGETLFVQSPPVLKFSDIAVEISPGGFLQAVEAAEVSMTEIIMQAIGNAKKVADLFCGTGTFTFPMAKQAEVLAVEYDKATLKQLKHGYENAQGLKPIVTELRDLSQDPLSAKELNAFDAVVFDPPRAGAKAQAAAIAGSGVPTVVAISCNPATLARDIKMLIDGGYKLEHITPIDQFLYSSHIEAVAVLSR